MPLAWAKAAAVFSLLSRDSTCGFCLLACLPNFGADGRYERIRLCMCGAVCWARASIDESMFMFRLSDDYDTTAPSTIAEFGNGLALTICRSADTEQATDDLSAPIATSADPGPNRATGVRQTQCAGYVREFYASSDDMISSSGHPPNRPPLTYFLRSYCCILLPQE